MFLDITEFVEWHGTKPLLSLIINDIQLFFALSFFLKFLPSQYNFMQITKIVFYLYILLKKYGIKLVFFVVKTGWNESPI